MLIKIRKLST